VLAQFQNVVLNGTLAVAGGTPVEGTPGGGRPLREVHQSPPSNQWSTQWLSSPPAWAGAANLARFVLGWITPRPIAVSPRQQIPDAFRAPGPSKGPAFSNQKADALAGARVAIVAADRSTRLVFQLRVLNAPGQTVPVSVPDGLVLQPLKDPARAVKGPAGGGGPALINGYCLNFAKLPPQAGMQYRVADHAVQEQYAPIARIMRASNTLAADGRLHPDTNPIAYADSITQLSIWSTVERWTPEEIERHFLEMTRKNVEATGRKWTGDLERLARQLVPPRLRDVAAVEAEAKRLAAGQR
jgi:hypothetical protein